MQTNFHDIVLQVSSLTKKYGKLIALNDVSLSIPRGQATAVIGQNGAGKTTLVEIIVNLRRADHGTVHVFGVDISSHPDVVSRIGVQLQEVTMFPMVTVKRYLKLFSKLYGVPHPPDELLYQLGIHDHLNKKFSELSGGLKQRVLLAFALLNDPDILILDEPSAGLDPIARETLWEFIENWLKDRRRTLLLTSHFMDEVERLCSHVVVLANGRIVAADSVPALLQRMPPTVKTLQSAYSNLVGVS
jgi:ABC-2 type transport system ATP-binding protein